MYAIVRGKAARNASFWAVHLKRSGKLHYKRFYDLKHGGSKDALAAAIAWRDEKLKMLAVLTKREFHQQKRSNNTSGVPGVHFLAPANQPQGFWQAKIKLPDGRTHHKNFSVRKYGAEEAFNCYRSPSQPARPYRKSTLPQASQTQTALETPVNPAA